MLKNCRPRLSREAGQSTVEYILILMVTVVLILTIVYQFSTAFRAYAEQIFDGYLACLLETGELPGGQGCTADMKPFNIADGKPLLTGGLSSSSDGGGSGSGQRSRG